MTALRSVIALVGDYRFTATIAFVVFMAVALRLFGAEIELLAAVLVIGCISAGYEHSRPHSQDKRRSKPGPK
jgi:hypothetical protein